MPRNLDSESRKAADIFYKSSRVDPSGEPNYVWRATDQLAKGYSYKDCLDLIEEADRTGITPKAVLDKMLDPTMEHHTWEGTMQDIASSILSTVLYRSAKIRREENVRSKLAYKK